MGDHATGERIAAELRTYLAEQIEHRRFMQEDTVINAIVTGSVDGRPLSDVEQPGMLQALVIAGHETTVNSIGTMVCYLAVTHGLREAPYGRSHGDTQGHR